MPNIQTFIGTHLGKQDSRHPLGVVECFPKGVCGGNGMDIHYLQSSTFPNSSCILVMVPAFGKPSFQGSLCSDVTGILESPGRDRWLSEGSQEVLWQG